jgi:Spy/CpxP family protein refolding chaperone
MKKAFVVLAATLSISSAFAQTAATPAAPASPAEAAAHHEQRVEQRIAYLHSALKITSAQESQWNAFADVMRSNSQSMSQLFQQRAAGEHRSALDDMKQYAQIAQVHADDMQKLVAAFEPLYNSLSPEQKTLADTTFREHGRHPGHPGAYHRRGAKPSTNAAPATGASE